MFHIQLHAVGMRLDQHDKSLFSGVNLQLKKGWLAIVGANGCGKSTLLRIILGELAPTSGQVQKKGIVVMNSLGQDTLVEPIHFSNFKDSYANEDLHLKTDLGLHELCHRPWSELSYGEKNAFR